MILSDSAIREAMAAGRIKIEPFRDECLGSNSYDVHLGPTLAVYEDGDLDAKREHKLRRWDIPENGALLYPGELFLGSTVEYTETLDHVPFVDGKSSGGRLGISIHCTAGRGDTGYRNHWTLEMWCIRPVRVYAYMPIGQLIYFTVDGKVTQPYADKPSAKYTERNALPVGSAMWKNFKDGKWT